MLFLVIFDLKNGVVQKPDCFRPNRYQLFLFIYLLYQNQFKLESNYDLKYLKQDARIFCLQSSASKFCSVPNLFLYDDPFLIVLLFFMLILHCYLNLKIEYVPSIFLKYMEKDTPTSPKV